MIFSLPRFALRATASAVLAAALVASAASPAPAQQRGAAPAPAAQPQSFGSWQRACDKVGRTEICSLRQLVGLKENPSQPVLAVAIGRLTSDRKMAMVVKLPVQIDRNAGIAFWIDDGGVLTIPVQGCDAGSCTSSLTLTDPMQKLMREGKQATIAFRTPQGQGVPVPVSLQGLGRGIAALK